MNNLKYITHFMLHSKYKIIFTIIIYLFIIVISIKYNNNYHIIDCMQRNVPIEPRPNNIMEYVQRLEYENTYLRNHIETLERELQREMRLHMLNNAQYSRVMFTLIQENLNLQEQLTEINNEIRNAAELIDTSQTNSPGIQQNNSNNGEADTY